MRRRGGDAGGGGTPQAGRGTAEARGAVEARGHVASRQAHGGGARALGERVEETRHRDRTEPLCAPLSRLSVPVPAFWGRAKSRLLGWSEQRGQGG